MANKRRDGLQISYTRDELIERLQDFVIEEGRIPTSRDADRGVHGMPSVNVYAREFGSWSEAIRVMNLPVDPRGGHNRHSKTPDGNKAQARSLGKSRISSTKLYNS